MRAEDYERAEKAFRENDVGQIQSMAKAAERRALFWLIPGAICLVFVSASPILFLFGSFHAGAGTMLLFIACLIFAAAKCLRQASVAKTTSESLRLALRLKEYFEKEGKE